MTACFYPNFGMSKPLEKFRFINTINLKYNNLFLDDIIRKILINYCKMDIIGYNMVSNKYWGKKNNSLNCNFYFELKICNKKNNVTEIKINPSIGSDLHIKQFIYNLDQAIKLFST